MAIGWLARKIDAWASNKQRQEMTHFVSLLKSMDGSEIGVVVAVATHVRHQLEAQGHNPTDPIAYTAINPEFALLLSRTAISLQKQQRLQDAAAFMVWLHTARAAIRLELRSLGRDLWRELARGFPHVEEGALSCHLLLGVRPNIEGADQFPQGFTPEPL